MGLKEKISNAKSTNWLTEGMTKEEIEKCTHICTTCRFYTEDVLISNGVPDRNFRRCSKGTGKLYTKYNASCTDWED